MHKTNDYDTSGAGNPSLRQLERLRALGNDERLYVFTHPDFLPLVRQRMDDILEGRNPSFVGFGR